MNTNETKHTPGPWKAVGLTVCQVPPGGREIIFGAHNTRSGDKDERQANARLIAAAPELLEALREFVSLMPSAEGLGGHAPIGAFQIVADLARAAIAKAEGR